MELVQERDRVAALEAEVAACQQAGQGRMEESLLDAQQQSQQQVGRGLGFRPSCMHGSSHSSR